MFSSNIQIFRTDVHTFLGITGLHFREPNIDIAGRFWSHDIPFCVVHQFHVRHLGAGGPGGHWTRGLWAGQPTHTGAASFKENGTWPDIKLTGYPVLVFDRITDIWPNIRPDIRFTNKYPAGYQMSCMRYPVDRMPDIPIWDLNEGFYRRTSLSFLLDRSLFSKSEHLEKYFTYPVGRISGLHDIHSERGFKVLQDTGYKDGRISGHRPVIRSVSTLEYLFELNV